VSDSPDNDIGDIRFRAMQTGTVYDRNDPKNLGRVKITIPGLADGPSTGWALPLGLGGGAPQRGLKFVPALGAEVAVFFKGGDPDAPYYLSSNWGVPNGTTEMPTDATGLSSTDAPDVHCIETARYKITIDDRADSPGMRFVDKNSGDTIVFDGSSKTGPGILIKGTASVFIQTDGAFIVESSMVVINGRTLAEGSTQI
jgi:hypothetical protein